MRGGLSHTSKALLSTAGLLALATHSSVAQAQSGGQPQTDSDSSAPVELPNEETWQAVLRAARLPSDGQLQTGADPQAETPVTAAPVAAAPVAAAPVAGAPARTNFTVLQLPLVRNGALYDDVVARATPDGRIEIERQSLINGIERFIREEEREAVFFSLPDTPYLTPEVISETGVVIRYDPSRLEIVIERIDPTLQAVQALGLDDQREVPITSQPERFSAYLNVTGDFSVLDFDQFETPAAIVFGAIRYDNFVFEFDGGYDENLTLGGGGFYRRQARVVFDEYEHFRRWSGGDLQLNGIPLVAGTLLGGVAVEKGRRVFSSVAPLTNLGGQQFLLDRDATVEVLIDGQQVQTLQLNAGAYDLGQLRAQYAGTNAQLFITDVTGRRQLADFDTFIDPIDLPAGEDEYSAAIGFVATDFIAQPEYGGNPAFSGFYRRGITNRLIIGGAVQLSEDVQLAASEFIFSPKSIPGRFELSAGASTGNDTGFALRGAYSLQAGSGARASQFTLSVDYRSANFTTLADAIGIDRVRQFNLTANYVQNLSERTTIIAGVNWFDRQNARNSRTIFAEAIHRFDRFRVTGGVEFGSGPFANDFGIRVGINVPFGTRSRADASYNSRRENFRAFASRSFEDRVGSFGYNVGVRRSPGSASVDGSADYVGNRFNSRLVVTTSGPGISSIDDRQQARLQVGTSIAITGGKVAIGRPISDSFIIAEPHENISDEQVILGRSVSDRRYDSLSGALGPALGSRLQSYSRQNVIYDLRDGPLGYDIGTGIETLFPAYRSGYHLVVGTDATVSAYGFLNVDGERADLVGGTITSPDDEDYGSEPFFTNSVGRFAIIGLRPGKTYEVRTFDPAAVYTIRVPEESDPLYQLGEVELNSGGNNQE